MADGESNPIILTGTPSIHKISAETVKLATAGWVPNWKRPDREPRRLKARQCFSTAPAATEITATHGVVDRRLEPRSRELYAMSLRLHIMPWFG